MREAYKDVMDRIEVTPEMQTRILKTIRDADIQGRSKSRSRSSLSWWALRWKS